MTHVALKLVHVSAVAVSFCGFAARGLGVIGALTVFGYIVSVALTKTPLGVLVWL